MNSEALITKAVMSTCQRQLANYQRSGIRPTAQVIEIYRRLSFGVELNELIPSLQQGLALRAYGQIWITETLIETEKRRRLKALSRVGRQKSTIYKRNSVRCDRRRQSSDALTGKRAEREKNLRQTVRLNPITEDELRKRNIRLMKEEAQKRRSTKRRGQKDQSLSKNERNPTLYEKVMELIARLSEKNGVLNPKAMQERIKENIETNNPQPIIIIWGPPYEKQGKRQDSFVDGQPEIMMLKKILKVFDLIKSFGLNILPILIYADLYGTEINDMPPEEVSNYFNQIKSVIPPDFIITTISQLLLENKIDLNDQAAEPTREEIESARKIQFKLGNKPTFPEIFLKAKKYRRMRLVEGQLLTGAFNVNGVCYKNVIKLATAPDKRKDLPYESDMPIFYVKNMTRAAWNKPRN